MDVMIIPTMIRPTPRRNRLSPALRNAACFAWGRLRNYVLGHGGRNPVLDQLLYYGPDTLA
jgi:hypothetical protein